MKSFETREYWLDLVKGVAIIGVVLQHSLQRTIFFFDQSENAWLTVSNSFIDSSNMQWFFVVSGVIYFMKREKYLQDIRKFIRVRFYDLMIPYIILGPLVWLGKYIFSSYVKNPVTMDDLLNMFVVPIAFMWYIYVLFVIEVLVILIDKFVLFSYRYKLAFFFFLCFSLALTTTYSKDIFWRTSFFIFWYYLGGLFYSHKEKIKSYAGILSTVGGGDFGLFFLLWHCMWQMIFSVLLVLLPLYFS